MDITDRHAERETERQRERVMTDRRIDKQTDRTNRTVLLHQLVLECTFNILEYI